MGGDPSSKEEEFRGSVLVKIELSDTDHERIIKALEWYYAYTVAQKRDDGSYKELAERLKKKEPQSETRTEERKEAGLEYGRAEIQSFHPFSL